MDDLELITQALKACQEIMGNNYHLFQYEISDERWIYATFNLKYKTEVITFLIWEITSNSAKFLTVNNLTDNINLEFNKRGIKTF